MDPRLEETKGVGHLFCVVNGCGGVVMIDIVVQTTRGGFWLSVMFILYSKRQSLVSQRTPAALSASASRTEFSKGTVASSLAW